MKVETKFDVGNKGYTFGIADYGKFKVIEVTISQVVVVSGLTAGVNIIYTCDYGKKQWLHRYEDEVFVTKEEAQAFINNKTGSKK